MNEKCYNNERASQEGGNKLLGNNVVYSIPYLRWEREGAGVWARENMSGAWQNPRIRGITQVCSGIVFVFW